MAKLRDDLEAIAGSFRRRRSRTPRQITPTSQLEAELVLVGERLEEARRAHEKQSRGLFGEECRINTDLLRLRSYNPRIYWHEEKTRESLKKRRQALRAEQRRLDREHEREVFDLHERLFKLLQEHAWLRRSAE